MRPRLRRRAASSLIVVVLASVIWVNAGSINPPAGPVTGTMKTLSEVEPRIAINASNTPGDADSLFKITQPGSYFLTGNVTGVIGKHGVEIAASGVTLDLNGFQLMGVPGMGLFDGVSVTAIGLANIAIKDGSIRNWGDEGIDLGTISATNCRVAGVLASANTGLGIRLGAGGTVTNCSAHINGAGGIAVGTGCMVSNCTSLENQGVGITTGSGCTVAGCTVRTNVLGGISTLFDCLIADSAVVGNLDVGINAGERCTIVKTTISGTVGGPGVSATDEGLRVESCSINNNSTFGVVVDTPSGLAELAVVKCTIRGNGSAGISSEASTQVLDSVIAGNGAGINLTGSCLVRGCTINSNIDSGIELTGNANVVANNTLSSNALTLATSAGILVQGTDNTIDGNRLFSNVQGGIKVNTSGNLVLRNYLARTGATISAVAGNAVAQILSPGAGFVSTDPNANLTY